MGTNAQQKLDVNAFNERFNRTLHEDFVEYEEELSGEDLRMFNDHLPDYLDRYNGQRPHQALNYQTPCQMIAQQLPGLSNMWWPNTATCFLVVIHDTIPTSITGFVDHNFNNCALIKGEFDMGIDLNSVSSAISPKISQEQDKVADMLKNVDVNDPVSMVKMQMEYTRYNMEVGFMSSMVKDIKDSVNQVVQRM